METPRPFRLALPPAQPRRDTLLAVELGGYRLALTRQAAAAPTARAPFGLGALTGLAIATVALAGASASPRPEAIARYSVSVDVPAPIVRVVRRAPRPAPGRVAKRVAPALPVDTPFEGADAPYVARAMATGAMQEWVGADGQLRFLTAGPARVEGERTCRDMALLIRLAEGGSRVRSTERCTTEPLGAPLPEPDPNPIAAPQE